MTNTRLSRQNTSFVFVMTEHLFSVCRNKTHLSSRQKCACHNKTFVTTNISVTTKLFSQQIFLSQQKFCHNKHTLVITKDAATKLLSQQKIYSWQLPHDTPHPFCFTEDLDKNNTQFKCNIYPLLTTVMGHESTGLQTVSFSATLEGGRNRYRHKS